MLALLPQNSIRAARSANPISYAPDATRFTALPEPLPLSTVTSSFSAAKYPLALASRNSAAGPSKRQSSWNFTGVIWAAAGPALIASAAPMRPAQSRERSPGEAHLARTQANVLIAVFSRLALLQF